MFNLNMWTVKTLPPRQTSLILIPILGILLAGAAHAASMLESASPEEKKIFSEAKPVILQEGRAAPKILAESDESYFWVKEVQTKPLICAYSYSKDPEFLEVFVPLMEQILSQRFIDPTKPEWNGWWNYKGAEQGTFALIDHDAILYLGPVLMFVMEVRKDPKLKEKYGAKAEAWLKDAEATIRAWDKRGCWHDLDAKTGWYSTITEYPDKDGNLVKNTTVYSGGTVPYNKVNSFYEALALAYRITGDDWYRVRMEKSAKFWHDHWRDDGAHVEWNYRDHYLPADYESGVVGQGKPKTGAWVHPNSGYYMVDVKGATYLYDVGVFFKQPEMEKLVKTNLKFMWRGDSPPTLKNINGTDGKNKRGFLWTSLAHFDPKIRELWKASIENPKHTWTWQKEAIDYLIEVSHPISWEPRYTKEIPKR